MREEPYFPLDFVKMKAEYKNRPVHHVIHMIENVLVSGRWKLDLVFTFIIDVLSCLLLRNVLYFELWSVMCLALNKQGKSYQGWCTVPTCNMLLIVEPVL